MNDNQRPIHYIYKMSAHLQVDPVELLVLVLHLGAHVGRHVPEVADHRAHLLHVLLHLLLAVVVGDPESRSVIKRTTRV